MYPVRIAMGRAWVAMVDRRGAWSVMLSLETSWNMGDSPKLRRTQNAMSPRGAAIRNGMRQPHCCIATSPRPGVNKKDNEAAAAKAADVAVGMAEPQSARCCGGACSIT